MTLSRLLILASILAPLGNAQTPVWQRILTSTPAIPTGSFGIDSRVAIVTDAGRGVAVLVSTTQPAQAWEFDGINWSSTPPPPGHSTFSMAYDSTRNRVIAVGSSSSPVNTYAYNGSSWSQLPATNAPNFSRGYKIAYDSRRDRIVLAKYANGSELWEFDGATWQQRTSGGPPERDGYDIAFDEARGVTVLFGGGFRTDTWEWDGRSWFEHFGIPTPSARSFHAMAWHPVRQRVVLRGGYNSGEIRETWEWDGAAWTQLSHPLLPRFTGRSEFMTYLPSTGQMILRATAQNGVHQTWALTYNSPVTGTYGPFGAACPGSAGTPTLRPVGNDLPYINEAFDLQVTNVPTGIFNTHFGVVGFSNTTWAGTPLPADLSAFGFQGCTGYVSVDLVFPLAGSAGVVPWTLNIPNDTNLGGLPFYTQVLTLDPGVSGRGTVTDAGAGLIGLR